jgi:hypothetical protein
VVEAIEAESTVLTITEATLDVVMAPKLSVTWSSKDHVPVAVEEVVAKV